MLPVNAIGRVLVLLGAGAVALGAVLPWVTVKGLEVSLDLGVVGASAVPGAETVAGSDTSLWPVLVGGAALVAILGLFGVVRWVLAGAGLILGLAGGALLYYVANVVEIETRDAGGLRREVLESLLTGSVGLGPPLIVAGGAAILAGALVGRR